MTGSYGWPRLLARTYDMVRGPLSHVEEQLLDRRTPCAEWTLRDLVKHLIGAIEMFASAAGAPTAGERRQGTTVEVFDAAAQRNLAAWDALTDPEAPLHLPFGTFPAHRVAAINQLDSLVHGWDVAAALELPYVLPDELAEAALPTAEWRCRQQPPSPVWGPELPAQGNSPQERLLALTGRNTTAWPKTPVRTDTSPTKEKRT